MIANMIFETLSVGPLAVNCYILGSETDKTAIVIDAGGAAEEIADFLKKRGLTLRFIINTHAHFDHVGGVKRLQDLTGAKFLLHQEDAPLLCFLDDQANYFGMPPIPAPDIHRALVDNEEIPLGNKVLRVIHTPGHSPGSVCFLLDNVVFTGDTLFEGSIGRTDLYGGSYTKIIHSIKTRLFTLGSHVVVYPGHGDSTLIGKEKDHNPFFE